MRFIIDMNVDNDAFGVTAEERDFAIAEVLSIQVEALTDIAGRTGPSWPVLDINGNTIGTARFEE